jgi:hypothetical protein
MVEVAEFNSNVDIVNYCIDNRSSKMSFYLEVQGEILSGEPYGEKHVDTVIIFLDTDQNPQSGYLIDGIGADFMIEIYGWDNEVISSAFFSYTASDQDWNFWNYAESIEAAVSGSELEVQVSYEELFLNGQDVIDVMFYTQSWDRFEDFSDAILCNEKGILLVTYQGVGEDVISGNGNRLLKLELKALNTNITVNKLTLTRMGIGSDSDTAEIRLEDSNHQAIATGTLSNGRAQLHPSFYLFDGQISTFYIVVDMSISAISENSIGFSITKNHDITTDKGSVFIDKIPPYEESCEVSYIFAIPDKVQIDGAFADWEGKTIRNDTKWDVMRDDQDIIKYGLSETQEGAAFYLKVDGNILGGVKVPYWNTKTESGTTMGDGSPKTGEDIIYIFINKIPNYGYNDSLPFGADCMIEVQGRYNTITSTNYYDWAGTNGSDWTWNQVSNVDASLDINELEVSISWDELGIDPQTDSFEAYFMITDWEGQGQDYSDAEGVIKGPTR